MPGKTPEQIKANAAETSKEVELSRFANRYSHELPSRQKQLRRFARGTNQSAALINWMNQLGALDEKLRENMQRKFINLQVEAGAAAFRLHAPKTKH